MSTKTASLSASASTVLLRSMKRRNGIKKDAPRFRAVKINGRWCGNPSVKVDRRAIIESIRQDREG